MAISGTFGPGSAPTATVTGCGAGTQGSCLTTLHKNIFPTYMLQVNATLLPANATNAGGYFAINYELSQTCTASTVTGNSFFFQLRGVTLGPAVTIPPANKSYRGSMRIRNIDNQNVIITSGTSDGTAGAVMQTLSVDLTIDQTIFMKAYNGESGSNSIALKGWSIQAHMISSTATPSGLVSGKNAFYGLNHHYTYGSNPPNPSIISSMAVLGFNTLRVEWYGRSASSGGGIDNTTWITDMASAMQADGRFNLDVMCGISPNSAGGTFASELVAYNYYYDQGSYIASLTKPLGVVMYEMGNEVDASTTIRDLVATQGTSVSDFSKGGTNVATWSAWRGAMRGLYDGIHSVHPGAKVGSNAFVNASIWASDALWEGNAPDGTTGNNQVRWDWTNWHLYTEGDATSVDYSGLPGAKFNLLKYLHNAYGRPIVITEFNPAEGTASTETKIVTWLSAWYGMQHTLNIAGAFFYDWFDSPYRICNSNAAPTTLNSLGSALCTFISAHPAVK